jgi:hypothetical protein
VVPINYQLSGTINFLPIRIPMHPLSTHNEFLRLRLQGLSFVSISRRLGVSKPTLIKWSKQSQAELQVRRLEDQQRHARELSSSTDQEVAALNRRLTFLKHELVSRAFRDIASSDLETLAGELRQHIAHLESATGATSSSSSPAPPSESPPPLGPSVAEPVHP